MSFEFKFIAPFLAGILFILFAAILLIVGDFLSDWPVAVIPLIIGAFFLALASNNKRKLKDH